jgi:CheY-like chemotaxis protein
MKALRIFVVEDHPDTLAYLKIYLESLGHTVCHCGSLAHALEQIPRSDCDLLLSDVGLPDGTGWELLERLKSEGRSHPPVAIAMSGYGRLADQQRSQRAGFCQHLIKPFDLDRFESVMEWVAAGMEQRAAPAVPVVRMP